ncbi:MAG: TlyA family RNA methyltransferase [Wolinella sp.]
MRLDALLVALNLVDSRTRAQSLILKGVVKVDGKVVLKSSTNVVSEASIEIDSGLDFVSRAGLKLYSFLESHKDILLKDRVVLDIGSSTGGFAQVALKCGAKHVVCVDVGSNQLHKNLRCDSRISLFEETDIRDFPPHGERLRKLLCACKESHANFGAESLEILGNSSCAIAALSTENMELRFSLLLCDVSFISLSKILPEISRLCRDEAILLFKPQFEVGRDVKRSAKGVVQDSAKVAARLDDFITEVEVYGFKVVRIEPSKLKGKEGNEEIFIHIKR